MTGPLTYHEAMELSLRDQVDLDTLTAGSTAVRRPAPVGPRMVA